MCSNSEADVFQQPLLLGRLFDLEDLDCLVAPDLLGVQQHQGDLVDPINRGGNVVCSINSLIACRYYLYTRLLPHWLSLKSWVSTSSR